MGYEEEMERINARIAAQKANIEMARAKAQAHKELRHQKIELFKLKHHGAFSFANAVGSDLGKARQGVKGFMIKTQPGILRLSNRIYDGIAQPLPKIPKKRRR